MNYPLTTVADLERRLEESLGIDHAHVFAEPSLTGIDRLGRFGVPAAAVIAGSLVEAKIIGVSWGTHVYSAVKAISEVGAKSGTVVQCSGAVGAHEPAYDGARISRHLALALGYQARMLHSPLIVESAAVAAVLLSSRAIDDAIEVSKRADVLLLGVGNPFDETAGLRRAGYLSADDIISLRDNDAASDTLGFHLDKDGKVLDIDLNKRIVGLHPAALKSIPNVIVVATGLHKSAPIRAAARGG
jgi:DNA-binding transcriptional regulator LsrR (DeoR family)